MMRGLQQCMVRTLKALPTTQRAHGSGVVRGYAALVSDAHRGNVDRFKIVDSTLREGEQFSTAFFNTHDKVEIATILDDIGVDYIELTTPVASEQSFRDCQAIAKLGLKAKVLTHTRCAMSDVKAAVESGVDGVSVYMATSAILRQFSHGKGIDKIIEAASEVVDYARAHNVEIRFSCEDTFRSDLNDVLRIYKAVNDLGVVRVGVADTVGVATPLQVLDVVGAVRSAVTCDIEYHTHDDTGCCIANALVALQAGATHIDTCVLGIGERNGITPLGGFLARMYTIDKAAIKGRYKLERVAELESVVAEKVGIDVPFNNCVTGAAAFTHKAGVHSKAVMLNPAAYEVIDPTDFGVERNIQIAHRLTGWNAIQQRATTLGVKLTDGQVKSATAYIKNLADTKNVSPAEVDAILRAYEAVEAREGQATPSASAPAEEAATGNAGKAAVNGGGGDGAIKGRECAHAQQQEHVLQHQLASAQPQAHA